MEYAILGNAAFFAVAFAMQMGWFSLDMLGFGQDDDDDDVAVKNPDPEDAKNAGYTAANFAAERTGTSGNDTLGSSTSSDSVALFGMAGNDSLVGSALVITSKATLETIRLTRLTEMITPMVAVVMTDFTDWAARTRCMAMQAMIPSRATRVKIAYLAAKALIPLQVEVETMSLMVVWATIC